MKANVINENVIDEMVDFLLPLVKEPVDRDEARAALWDASQEQFEEMMAALIGGNVNPTKAESLPSSTPQA